MANLFNKNQKNAWVIKSQVDASVIASSKFLFNHTDEVGSVYEAILQICRGKIEKYVPSDRDSNRYLRLQNTKRGIVSPKRVPQLKSI